MTYIISNFEKDDFAGAAMGEELSYTKQMVEEGATYYGKTGDWVKVLTNLDSRFGETPQWRSHLYSFDLFNWGGCLHDAFGNPPYEGQ